MVKRHFFLSFIFLFILCLTGTTGFAGRTGTVLAEDSLRIQRTTASGMSIILQKDQSEIIQIVLLLKSGSGLEPANKKGIAQIMKILLTGFSKVV